MDNVGTELSASIMLIKLTYVNCYTICDALNFIMIKDRGKESIYFIIII